MAVNVPKDIAGYWGSIVSAASNRSGIGGAFAAVNDARAAEGLPGLSSIDAISMGQLYSLAVQQRNAGEAIQAATLALSEATGAQRDLLYNQTLDAGMVTTTINSGQDSALFVEPIYKVQYQVTDNQTGETSYRWLNLGTDLPSSIGELSDTIFESNIELDDAYETETSATGFAQVFMI